MRGETCQPKQHDNVAMDLSKIGLGVDSQADWVLPRGAAVQCGKATCQQIAKLMALGRQTFCKTRLPDA